MTSGLTKCGLRSSENPEALAGIALASTCHFLSVIVLYKLSRKVFSNKSASLDQSLSFVIAALHILNPAGAFLAAPYTEPAFCLLNFIGFYLYLDSHELSCLSLFEDVKVLLAGIIFGLATTIRSNGILSGILFAYGAVTTAFQILKNGLTWRETQRLFSLVVGGSLIALGVVYPQFLAYSEYCLRRSGDTQLRPWCDSRIPSVYSWVQSHYW